MFLAAGVDVGSTQTKAIIVNDSQEIVARALVDTGGNITLAGEKAFVAALENSGLNRDDVKFVVGTGYGRYKIAFGNAQVTEISCHARGAILLFPNTRTVIDIGGQDAKGIKISETGEVKDFVMNDKCAAGTGRFLANAAEVLELSLDEIGEISLTGTNPVRVSTVCAVFVESDVMSYLGQGRKVEDILNGLHSAIASRVIALVRRVGIEPEITFTGGVSRNVGMVQALGEKIGMPVNVSPDSQMIGAIGAALFALDRAQALVAA